MPISAQIIEAIEQLEAQLPASVLSKEDLSTQEKTVSVNDTKALLDILNMRDPHIAPRSFSLSKKKIVALRSRATMIELLDVLVRPQFAGSLEAALPFLKEAFALTTPIDEALLTPEETLTGTLAPSVWRDSDDQKFLDLAFVAQAAFLFTKDKLVLKAGKKLKKFNLLVVTPEEFIKKNLL